MIVITVPHGFCFASSGRNCDRRAMAFAKALQHYMPTSVIFASTQPRMEVDANRLEGRQTLFRQRLRQEGFPQASFIIDVHSFPPEDVWNGEVPPTTPMVMLSMDRVLRYPVQYTMKIARQLPGVGVLEGGLQNDVLTEAWMSYHIPGVLIEINEGLSDDDIIRWAGAMVSAVQNVVQ